MKAILLLCVPVLLANMNIACAQTVLNTEGKKTASDIAPPKRQIEELDWIDKKHMDEAEQKINALFQAKLGTGIRHDLTDLNSLQRIFDSKLVKTDDYKTLQAMGIVLGNVMQADFPNALEWKVYSDDLGRSRALCVKNTANCLFPVTMLERRVEAGIHPDVKKIYSDAILSMEKHLPQLPYGGGIMYRLPR
ncbi:DUF3806 domain-containing protein [Cellvibrio mixtus]|uniref:DUF3806 domain-containing protein n=1 Tax=Cellvibrio mixtus TaxID=39650 RepID=UPI001F43544E|nr:DUF3806 domain-containing protein [Cellvibrio mixtus]